jgi:hypothetical protein
MKSNAYLGFSIAIFPVNQWRNGGGRGWGGEEEKIFEPYSLKKGVQKNFPHYDN